MSYEVLARKWRPRSFDQLVGQEHVRRALVNGLDQDRLHHAYLFTGTRGIGKTTIARILAKCLNCETHGVTSTPCGSCSACGEIDAGRFIDLIEVDAASRTRVEETRELLENVPYAPTRGRYKVYLIDEVHMFSGHSFNALLKTLEEPPAHVKFILATTDPQKVPVTILSRCLQFNLRLMPVDVIRGQLEHIVASEGIGCDTAALGQLARAASGSMRDALSLLDQAIAFGEGEVRAADIEAMLGTLSRERLLRIVEAVGGGDGAAAMAEVEALAQQAADLEPVLVDLQALLHQLALAQVVPEAVDPAIADAEQIADLAARMPAAAIQLYHQIATHGRRELAWSPDPRSGLEMTLLRMLAFRPASGGEAAAEHGGTAPGGRDHGARNAGAGDAGPAVGPADRAGDAATAGHETPSPEQSASASAAGEPVDEARPAAPSTGDAAGGLPAAGEDSEWESVVRAMNLRGLAGELAANSVLLAIDPPEVRLALAPEHAHLGGDRYRERLEAALAEHLGHAVRLRIEQAVPEGAVTPAEREKRLADEQVREAERSIRDDPVVQALQQRFDATVESDSVRPLARGEGGAGNE